MARLGAVLASVGLLVAVAVTWDSDKERQSKVIIKLATSCLIAPPPSPPPPQPSLSQIKALPVHRDSSRVSRGREVEPLSASRGSPRLGVTYLKAFLGKCRNAFLPFLE